MMEEQKSNGWRIIAIILLAILIGTIFYYNFTSEEEIEVEECRGDDCYEDAYRDYLECKEKLDKLREENEQKISD